MSADLKTERESAKRNYEKISRAIPNRIIKQEKNLYSNVLKNRQEPLGKLKLLYDFVEEIYHYAYRFTPCKRGCDHCCYYRIDITDIEAQYIEIENSIRRSSEILANPLLHTLPCPFLKGRLCSIYDSRPFYCRTNISLASVAKWCESEICNTVEFLQLRFSEIDRSFYSIVEESGSTKRFDIRQAFRIL